MSQKPISEIRRRMLEDMVVRRLGEKAAPLGSSSTALVLPTSLILLLGRPDGCTTISQLVTDPAGATHKSP
jgi:hypothetical protein